MARRASAKKPVDTSNFTAGVDEEPAAVVADLVAVPPAGEPGHGEAQVPPQASANFAMSDDPAVPPQFLRSSPTPAETPAASHPLKEQPLAPTVGTIYEHRIRILEAFQYPGNYLTAPEWIDRNWLVYADPDEKRGLPAGPALNVPTPRSPTGFALCRRADYIVRQELVLAPGLEPEVQVEVWPREEFERLFIPAKTTPKSEATT